jgi:hypothetical protein
MLANHPSKIPFRFYAVDDAKIRTEVCATDGLILVSVPMLSRLKSDNQLAAVLADGIAVNLQRQAARLAVDNRYIDGVQTAANSALVFIPFADFVDVGTAVAGESIEVAQEEQLSSFSNRQSGVCTQGLRLGDRPPGPPL